MNIGGPASSKALDCALITPEGIKRDGMRTETDEKPRPRSLLEGMPAFFTNYAHIARCCACGASGTGGIEALSVFLLNDVGHINHVHLPLAVLVNRIDADLTSIAAPPRM